MSARPRSLALAGSFVVAALAALAAAPRTPLADPWSHDAAQNNPVVRAPLGQCVSGIVPDGRDGAIIAVSEPCTLITTLPAHFPELTPRLYHLRRGDGLDPAWAASGVALPFTASLGLTFASDSAGGGFLGWSDTRNLAVTGRDSYVLHVRADGSTDPAYSASGLRVSGAPGSQFTPRLCLDGSGGILCAWADRRDSVANGTDVYAAHVLANGTLDPAWPANGRAVYAGVSMQSPQACLSDGASGAIVLWSERRNGPGNNGDVYAQHVLSNGTLDPAWPVGGLGVGATTNDEEYAGAMGDGAGGFYVALDDFGLTTFRVVHMLANGTLDPAWPAGGPQVPEADRLAYFGVQLMPDGGTGLIVQWTGGIDPFDQQFGILARHVLANGTLDPTWGANPRVFAPAPSNKGTIDLAFPLPDPAGGGLVTWYDDRVSGPGLYALRVDANLAPAAGWNPTGEAIATAPHSSPDLWSVPSGAGGAIYAFSDLRDSLVDDFDVYAQRLSERGRLGTDEPVLTSVRDVAADQGGRAMVRWYWSSYDTLPGDPVAAYDVWRRLDGPALTAERRASARVTSDGATDTFWEFVGSTPARGTSSYALAVSTDADSTALGSALETYEVDAHVAPANDVFTSLPDSGYSVDNLAPAAPTGFAGAYASGTATLHWDPVIAPDLAGYRLYRGVPSTFTPSLANRIATPTTTNYADPAGATYYYKLTAADVHGNESAAVTLLPTGALTGVDDTVAVALAFGRPAPDPALERTRFTYALPRAGRVRLLVYDIAGRLVRRLVDGAETAGVHGRDWDLADDRGARVRAGMYFARFEAAGGRMERRVLVAR